MFGKLEPEVRALMTQAEQYLVENKLIVGHKHIVLYSSFNLEGEVVSSWGLVTGINFPFTTLDYDALHGWLEIKGFEPYLTGQFEPEINSVDDPVLCEIALYAVPNKVWRASRILSVVDR